MESLANSYGNGFDPALEWLLRGVNTSPFWFTCDTGQAVLHL